MKLDFSLTKICTVLVFAGLAAYSLIFLYHGIRLVMYPYDVDNSEAYLMNQGLRIANGEFLYPPIEVEPYLVDNYPPVYPLVLGAITKMVGVCFHSARIVSLASTLAVAVLLFLWIKHYTQNKTASLYGALVFLSFYHVYDWCALARVDSLGLLFTIFGLYGAQRSWHWGFITLLMLLALYTKQSFFAAPLAVFFFYLYQNKKTAWLYFITLAASGIILFVLLNILTNNGAYLHLIKYNNNAYRLSDLIYYTRYWVSVYTVWGCAPILVFALGCNRFFSGDKQLFDIPILLFSYTILTIIESSLCGKIGSAPNYLLSLVCATSVGLGVMYHNMSQSNHESSAWAFVMFLVLNFTQLAGTFHLPLSGQMLYKHPLDFSYTPSTIDQQAATLLHNRLKRIESPVLSDRAGVALVAGHTPDYDPFIFTQLTHQSIWDQTKIIRKLQQKHYNAVILVFDASSPNWDRERFTEPFIASVREHYMIEQRYGAYYLYLPKTDG
jgi:hypothetical protein